MLRNQKKRVPAAKAAGGGTDMDFYELAKIENEAERVNKTYDIFNEDVRLNHSKAARVEFLTTVHYIEKYLKI